MPKKFINNKVLNLDGYELAFNDDFTTLDLTKWKINTMLKPENPKLNGIRNCAFYVDDSDILFVKDNKLHIRTMWKKGQYGEGFYTAWLESSVNHFPQYALNDKYKGFATTGGYFEVRCKVPKAIGIWSAFWLMPDNDVAFTDNDVQWSGEDGVEIDIMESPHYYRWLNKNKNMNIHVIHADGYDDRLKSAKSPCFSVENMYDEFHTYGLLWSEDKYTFYIDGYKTWETTHVYDGKQMGICKANEYMILSTEVAGSMENGKQYAGYVRNKKGKLEKFWCGNPIRNDLNKSYDFVVDYVKVYKKK